MPDPLIYQNSPPSDPLPSALSTSSQLITLLGIPVHLTGTGDVSLSLAYQKYRAFLIAFGTYEDMIKANTWTIA